jgi:CheY-like chemotaxis protein/anti-sigma regulatory factor (Ser/Thr protein kinase)
MASFEKVSKLLSIEESLNKTSSEQMLAIVSHDIKNPLCAIHLEAQMLLRVAARNSKSLFAEEVKIQANRILKTAEHMQTLITNLLEKNKEENGLTIIHKEEVDTAKLFQEVLNDYRPLIRQKSIFVNSSFPIESKGNLDKSKIFQVLSNLLSNAIKFTPDGGIISLSIKEEDSEILFSISDNGPGLVEDDLKSVFNKYWTSNKEADNSGNGLGLFICKTVVGAHGGRMMVENLPNGGACFSFTLPKEAKNYNIMVIDDDEDLSELISWALGSNGYHIKSFKDPRKAVDFLYRGKDVPNLIIADYYMHEMKGDEFLTIKSQIPLPQVQNCPVLMISASPLEVHRGVPREFYKEIITKPIDLNGLVSNMKKYIH